jgi:hypothetical protein
MDPHRNRTRDRGLRLQTVTSLRLGSVTSGDVPASTCGSSLLQTAALSLPNLRAARTRAGIPKSCSPQCTCASGRVHARFTMRAAPQNGIDGSYLAAKKSAGRLLRYQLLHDCQRVAEDGVLHHCLLGRELIVSCFR